MKIWLCTYFQVNMIHNPASQENIKTQVFHMFPRCPFTQLLTKKLHYPENRIKEAGEGLISQ